MYVSIQDRIHRNNNNNSSTTNNTNNNSNITSSKLKCYAVVVDYSYIPTTLLVNHLLHHNTNTPQELQLLTVLGVQVLSRAQYYRLEFLPSIQQLYNTHPTDTIHTLLHMLDEIKALLETDKEFLNFLRNVAFIPSASSNSDNSNSVSGNTNSASNSVSSNNGTSSSVNTSASSNSKLCRACDLFDPTDNELVTLLDSSFFPHPLLGLIATRTDLLVYCEVLACKLHYTGAV